jgi:hypothetical protein
MRELYDEVIAGRKQQKIRVTDLFKRLVRNAV